MKAVSDSPSEEVEESESRRKTIAALSGASEIRVCAFGVSSGARRKMGTVVYDSASSR